MWRATLFVTALLIAGVLASGGQAGRDSKADFGKWTQGPPARRDYFPIAVWLQSPPSAAKFKAAGINLFIGLWQGPTEAQLAELKGADPGLNGTRGEASSDPPLDKGLGFAEAAARGSGLP